MNARLSKPEKYQALEQAARWFAVFESGDVGDQQRLDWQAWLDESEYHRQAWSKVERVNQRFQTLVPGAASEALSKTELDRRKLLKNFVVLTALSTVTWQMARWQHVGATYKTARGEVAEHTLQDGTKLWLNTDSALDIAYSPKRREVTLLKGEILIDTGGESNTDARPFVVQTAHGQLQALGTRFIVRDLGEQTKVAVEQGAVAIKQRNYGPLSQPYIVEHNFETQFSKRDISPVTRLTKNSAGWVDYKIFAENMRLDDFVAELNRYYTGYINVSPEVADYSLVGVYPLQNVDRILSALEQSHPVRVYRSTPWWRSIEPLSKPSTKNN